MPTFELALTVHSVQEATRALRSWKTPDGEIHVDRESLGWSITLVPGYVSFLLTPDRPDIEPGDRVILILKVERPPNETSHP